jgi:hypothetical protein
MDDEWFILIDSKKEGPFSLQELKEDKRITPDTLVWKEGFKDWIAIRFVSELEDVFKDENVVKSPDEKIPESISTDLMQEQAALTLQQDPSQMILWILILILLLIYLLYQFK